MTGRRAVRVLPEFFILLDEHLPHERGPHGEPTAAEFAASDLLDIVDTFAARWDDLPMPIAGRPDYRVPILTGRLVHAAAGQLSGQRTPPSESQRLDLHRRNVWRSMTCGCQKP